MKWGIPVFVMLVASVLQGQEAIRSAYTRFVEERELVTIGEYLTGRESSGARVFMRSQDGFREGLYFVLELGRSSGLKLDGAEIEVRYLEPDSVDFETQVFTVPPLAHPPGALFCGLTGADWRRTDAPPLAWKVTLRAPDGSLIDEWESFLWEMPDGRN